MVNANAVRKIAYARSERETMSAGTSTSQKRTGAIVALAVLAALWPAAAGAQTGQVVPQPKFAAYDNNGNPCAGCKLFAYTAGTTTKTDTYTSSALSVANTNPVVLDSAGRATIFVDPTKSMKFTLAPASDTDPPAAAIWTVDNVVGPFSSVVSVTAANTRGVQISRSSADAGLSIASSGGSGKTYGIVSTTTGELQIRDDADGTPSLAFIGNNITAALTGTFTISGGLLSVTGAGAHSISGSVAGGNTLALGNTSSSASAYGEITIANNTGTAGRISVGSAASAFGDPVPANGLGLSSPLAGGVSIAAYNAAGELRLAAGSATTSGRVKASGRLSWEGGYASSGLTTPVGFHLGAQTSTDRGQIIFGDGTGYSFSIGHNASGTYTKDFNVDDRGYVTAPRNPAFLAYNSAADSGVLTGATVDFDTEVFDVASNFASDTFTAPVAGTYEFCAAVDWTDGGTLAASLSFNISGTSYQFYRALTTDAGAASGCVIISMTAAQTATVIITTADANIDVEGGSSPRITWFSGRLVQ